MYFLLHLYHTQIILKFRKSLFVCPRFSPRLGNGLPPNLVGTTIRAWDVSWRSPYFDITDNYGNIGIIMSLFLYIMTSQGDACWQVPACDLPTRPDLHRLYKHKLEIRRNETRNGGYTVFNMGTYFLFLHDDVMRRGPRVSFFFKIAYVSRNWLASSVQAQSLSHVVFSTGTILPSLFNSAFVNERFCENLSKVHPDLFELFCKKKPD